MAKKLFLSHIFDSAPENVYMYMYPFTGLHILCTRGGPHRVYLFYLNVSHISLLACIFVSRSSVTPREEASSSHHLAKKKCVVCGQSQHHSIREKFRKSDCKLQPL